MDLTSSDYRRFESYLSVGESESGCIEWTGGKFDTGYGSFWINNKNFGAHRIAFFIANGFFPIQVRHTCDNPPCCNPKHLLAGDAKSNQQDVKARKRYIRPKGWGSTTNYEEIKNMFFNKGMKQFEIVKETGYSPSHISNIIRGKYDGI